MRKELKNMPDKLMTNPAESEPRRLLPAGTLKNATWLTSQASHHAMRAIHLLQLSSLLWESSGLMTDLMGSRSAVESNKLSVVMVVVAGWMLNIAVQSVRVKNEGNRAGKEGREVFDIWKKLESAPLPC